MAAAATPECAGHRLPALFVNHGGGPLPLLNGPEGDSLYKGMAEIPDHSTARPTSILIISAHWEEETVSVSSSPAPAMLFDYYGFPPQTYEYEYPAPGNPELAARVADLISTATGQEAKLDPERGYDHGGETTHSDHRSPPPPLPLLPFSPLTATPPTAQCSSRC